MLGRIKTNQDKIRDSIVRIDISIPAAISNKLRDIEIRNQVKDASYITIAKEVRRENRLRMGKGTLEGVTPEEALKAYLETKYTAERASILLEYGEKLIQERNARPQ